MTQRRVDDHRAAKRRPPRPALDRLEARDDQASPRLSDREALHDTLFPELDLRRVDNRFWGNAKPPTAEELSWIKAFGRYPKFDPTTGKLSRRLRLEIANLKEATRIIVAHHYLHRGRTMAQLPYWIIIDDVPIGVILYSLPRLSVPLDGIPPMNLLELARIWISPDVQDSHVCDSSGQPHALAVASCAVGKSLRRVRQDWFSKYPNMPDIYAVVSWADTTHHEGVIYRAANFRDQGASGGAMHGNRQRDNGGRDQWNVDYAHVKTRFLYSHVKPLSERDKERLLEGDKKGRQLRLF